MTKWAVCVIEVYTHTCECAIQLYINVRIYMTELIRTLVAFFTDCRLFRAGHVCVPAGCQAMPGSDRQAISEQVAPS